MNIPLYQLSDHWETSAGIDDAAVAFSALRRGDSPVVTRTRAVNFVLDGVERYELDGRIHVVKSGEFLILDAGTSARVAILTRAPTVGLCVYLPVSDAEPAVPVQPSQDCNPLAIRTFQFSSRATSFTRMLTCYARHLADGRTISQAARAALVGRAVREFTALESSLATEMTRIDARKSSTRQDILQRLHRVRDHMHANTGGAIPLDVLARIAGMSQFHLSRTFRAVMGVPPAAYHLQLRMHRARDDLASGHLSVDDAARSYGFSEISSFSRAFKRVIGSSPSRGLNTSTAMS